MFSMIASLFGGKLAGSTMKVIFYTAIILIIAGLSFSLRYYMGKCGELTLANTLLKTEQKTLNTEIASFKIQIDDCHTASKEAEEDYKKTLDFCMNSKNTQVIIKTIKEGKEIREEFRGVDNATSRQWIQLYNETIRKMKGIK